VANLIFGALFGSALGLYYFNRFPARVFIGNIGTLGLGAALAAGVVLGHIEFYGAVAIAPAFYEATATAVYGLQKKNGDRKQACRSPMIQPDGTLVPPTGAGRYTLAYLILSKRPMPEKSLVRLLLAFYAISGGLAILLSLL
jgi:UDP-N-acetylglucosamine--dolichyl-phosphate N-acetylglucosaminephosphotransferase